MAKKGNKRKTDPAKYIISWNSEKCIGCGACEIACSLYNLGKCAPSESGIHFHRETWTGKPLIEVCRQCMEPDCYYACPVDGALYIDEKTGARAINMELCIGCQACERACPFNSEGSIIRYIPEKKKSFKCNLCSGDPQCVNICAVEALEYAKWRQI